LSDVLCTISLHDALPLYSPGSVGVKVASPSPSTFTSKSSIAMPCIPSSLTSVTLTSSPASTTYSAWSTSQFVALISKSLLAVVFSEELLSSVCSAELSTPSFVLPSLLLPPQAASTRIKPRNIVAKKPFFTLFPSYCIFLIGSKTLTKTIVLINYQLTVQKRRQKWDNYGNDQSIVFVHDNYCFKKLIKTAQKNGSILLHDKNDFQKLVMHIEKEWFF